MSLNYHLVFGNFYEGSRLIAEPDGNNVKNWAIRSVTF